MSTKPLGNTGIHVSALGFGGSSLGGVFGPVDDDEAIRAVHAALDLGINYFDVSPFYGAGCAESLLGRALRGVARDRFVLSTKVGRYGDDDFDFSAARVRTSLDESASRLGVSAFDIVLVHDIEFGNTAQIVSETLPALRALVRDGKICAIGVSAHPIATLQEILDAAPLDVVLSYAHHHLFDTSSNDLRLGEASLIEAAPLAMGLLTNDGPPAWHPAPAPIREACARAAMHARSRGIDLAKLALGFALKNDRATSTLVGMRTVAEVEANVTNARAPIDARALDELEPFFAPIHGATWPSGRKATLGSCP
jgi:L-galactose dehydrogenase